MQGQPAGGSGRECSPLTVLSANLCHDWPRFRGLLERLGRFARLVESVQADLVLMQEVVHTPKLWADEWLADRLGMARVYTRANGHAAIGFEEGLAVLSRFPLSEARLRQLGQGSNPFVRRLALATEVHTPCGRVQAYSVHLGLLPRQNRKQLDQLQSWVTENSGQKTALVGGDFNTHESSPHMLSARAHWLDTFRRRHPQADGITHELPFPLGKTGRRRLDYIFLHPGDTHWEVLEARHLDAPGGPHSDHRAVLARLGPGLEDSRARQ